ncbi:N,N-dimethylformamidase beta subunit family domain-containing protein [Catellatospora methionotrophica]|uniref:N,N-dimethylformamidase beta subunit family domain-containing protein n=1 Tax=Catellatospora methionotrophica TaxID=121620 RepID=UPI0033F1F495
MRLTAYAEACAVDPGKTLGFVVGADSGHPAGHVTVVDVPTGQIMATDSVDGPHWSLHVPEAWPSSLYRAAFRADGSSTTADSPDADAHFVVRGTGDADVLVSVPFLTWQAYNRSGEPGESLYYAEEPTRAARVSFDRPGGGPPPQEWEHGLLRWLTGSGLRVAYCANLDLHDQPALLARHRMLVVNGHDEYWTWEMRDHVEAYVRRGGNLAIFAANTCWWQIRLEDGGRTMVCHREAVTDPMTAVDPSRVTVEWSSAPVNRPENALTGVSYRRGAGTWGEHMPKMREESYRARFADHWVFAGTGLRDGDAFGRGALGYETDAADFTEVDGVPRVTGRDGTPPDFVILATADLRHWRHYGQGGHATMGVHRLGQGTVFTAATVNWGSALGDPVVDRITRNVFDRLSGSTPADFELIGPAVPDAVLAACEGLLFAAARGVLRVRELCGQNLAWREIDAAPDLVALGSPREAYRGMPLGLIGVTRDGWIVYRDPVPERSLWSVLGDAPPGTIALGCVNATFFAVADGALWTRTAASLADGTGTWQQIGPADGVVALTGLSSTLFAATAARLLSRPPVDGPFPWTDLGAAADVRSLTGAAGWLVAGGETLRRRPATASISGSVGLPVQRVE